MANYTIINDEELCDFLVDLIIIKYYLKSLNWHFVSKIYSNHYNKSDLVTGEKDKDIIYKAAWADLNRLRDTINIEKKTIKKLRHKRRLSNILLEQFEDICVSIGGNCARGKRLLLARYLDLQSDNYMKRLSNGVYEKTSYRTVDSYSQTQSDCLIRNILNNEQLLRDKIKNKFPFWFVDSGYTNFIHSKSRKGFHRLCRNDIHADKPKHVFPMDRLLNIIVNSRLRTEGFLFPKHWRTTGNTVLIIPPSLHVCKIYGLDQQAWVKEQKEKLKKVTDKKIKIRKKQGTRKTRTTLYQDLLKDESIYCVVGYNSNALTEAVWAGVPVITLGKHITLPVSRNSIEQINNLYRDDVSQWLCYLSYSQFTSEEMFNGIAKKIMETWHV